MNFTYPIYWPCFYTATIYQWYPLLADDKYKKIITQSLNFLVTNKRIVLNAFVIMSNHIHLIWQVLPGHTAQQVQLSFMRFTAQQIKFNLITDNPELLKKCKVDTGDRIYQIWKREPLTIELFTPVVFDQKLEYIHYNLVKAGLCKYPEEYHYSSALFYHNGTDHFNMLAHYLG